MFLFAGAVQLFIQVKQLHVTEAPGWGFPKQEVDLQSMPGVGPPARLEPCSGRCSLLVLSALSEHFRAGFGGLG